MSLAVTGKISSYLSIKNSVSELFNMLPMGLHKRSFLASRELISMKIFRISVSRALLLAVVRAVERLTP